MKRELEITVADMKSGSFEGALTRFETRARGRTRNYIARNKMDLYPGRNDLCENESREIVSGWWIGVNLNKLTIDKILRIALEVAQIRKGQDVDYYLGV